MGKIQTKVTQTRCELRSKKEMRSYKLGQARFQPPNQWLANYTYDPSFVETTNPHLPQG